MDPILMFEEETHERCDCHVCNTLRTLLAANVEAEHDRRSPTSLLLTFKQAGELLGVGEATVRELVHNQELRAITIQSYGRQRIPRAEIGDYVSRLLTGQLRAWSRPGATLSIAPPAIIRHQRLLALRNQAGSFRRDLVVDADDIDYAGLWRRLLASLKLAEPPDMR